jgi:hypothetical protein
VCNNSPPYGFPEGDGEGVTLEVGRFSLIGGRVGVGFGLGVGVIRSLGGRVGVGDGFGGRVGVTCGVGFGLLQFAAASCCEE